MSASLKLAELRHFSDYFRNFPYDRCFLACALAEPDAAVYVDDFHSPQVVFLTGGSTPVSFVWGHAGFAGEVAAKLLECSGHRERGYEILSAADESWRSAFVAASEKDVWHTPRVDYQMNLEGLPRRIATHPTADSTTEIVPLEEELIDRVGAELDSDFSPYYFRQHGGLGFAAVEGGRIVSVAWTPVVGGWTNIGIATQVDCRRRGLAAAVGQAVVDQCRGLGVHLHTTTDERNAAARAWAGRLGFGTELPHDWIVFRSKR